MKVLIKSTIEQEIKSENEFIELIKECFKKSIKYWESTISFWDDFSLDFISENCDKWKVSCYLELGDNTYLRKERTLKEILDIVKKEKISF